MRERGYRLECPVCPGVMMDQIRPADDLPLDVCRRCGGIWFDEGEVSALRGARPQALYALVQLSDEAFRAKCHACGATIKRTDNACSACRRVIRLRCPACRSRLRLVERGNLRLDVCDKCRGIWFDNFELQAIWNTRVLARREAGPLVSVAPRTVHADAFPVEMLFFLPDLGYVGGLAVEGVVYAADAVVSAAPEIAGAAVEATGSLAGEVFAVIAEIIGGIFS